MAVTLAMKEILKNAKPVGGLVVFANLLKRLPLAKYASPDGRKKQLLGVFDGTPFQNEISLNFAVQSRKKEIEWLCLYLPALLFGYGMLSILYAGISLHATKYAFLSIFLLVSLAVSFKMTFYKEYEELCKRLMLTAEELRKNMLAQMTEKIVLESNEKVSVLRQEEPTIFQEEMSALQGVSILQETRPQQEETLVLKQEEKVLPDLQEQVGEPAKRLLYGEELNLLWEELGEGFQKGRVPLFLLDQLIRWECKKPSIHDPGANIANSVRIPGCKPKNIISKYPDYWSREALIIKTGNSKSTHLKYLRILQEYYNKIDDLALYNQAKDLSSFITSIKIERKMRKDASSA